MTEKDLTLTRRNFMLAISSDNASAMEGGMGWASVSGYMAGISAAKYLGKT